MSALDCKVGNTSTKRNSCALKPGSRIDQSISRANAPCREKIEGASNSAMRVNRSRPVACTAASREEANGSAITREPGVHTPAFRTL